jgi:hypothetical protein
MSASMVVKRKIAAARKFANFRGMLFFAQRKITKAGPRRRLSNFVARFLPPAASAAMDLTPEAATLEAQGFVALDDIVTPVMVDEIRSRLEQQPVYAPYILNAPLVSIDDPALPDSHTLVIPERGVVTCPHVLDIANHPQIIATVEGVFRCKPTIGYVSAWWSVPTADGKPREAENFHRDLDDVNFIKLFVYLSDVEEENGPHEFIRGSHVIPELHKIRRYTDDEVLATFGADRLVRFIGKAGTVFLENTYGLHRGQPVRSGKRLVLQIVYSMLPMAYGPVRPYRRDVFPPTLRQIDPYINRVYVGRA